VPARKPTKLLVADHDPLARQAVREAMAGREDLEVVGEAATSMSAVATLRVRAPDVVLLDSALPPAGGVAATAQLLAMAPALRIVLFAITEDTELALAALEAGAAGFLCKDIELDALARALRSVAHGEAAISRRLAHLALIRLRSMASQLRGMRPVRSQLTNRQWEVLELLADGHSQSEIAAQLAVSPDTVRGHVRLLLRSLGASSPAEAVALAKRLRVGLAPA
jgi:two-component system, NarL family, response regulator LiaR